MNVRRVEPLNRIQKEHRNRKSTTNTIDVRRTHFQQSLVKALNPKATARFDVRV